MKKRPSSARIAAMRSHSTSDGASSRVPGLSSPEEIARLSRALALPVNVYAGYAGAPTAESLAQAGARRISLGCGPLQAALGLVGQLASEAFAQGRFDAMDERMLSVGELNALFSSID